MTEERTTYTVTTLPDCGFALAQIAHALGLPDGWQSAEVVDEVRRIVAQNKRRGIALRYHQRKREARA